MRLRSSFLAVCLLISCAGLWAQTAQIQGIVRDSSGAVVPGAEVKATQTNTATVRTVTSGSDGVYVLAELPVGPYRLEVSKQGFTTYVQTGIVLQVGSSPTVDPALKVGAVSEQVQVEANAALVETEKTSIGQVIENERILDLPLNGRQVTDLIQLAGATVPAGVVGTGGIPGGVYLSVAGGQTFGVGYFLDGTLYSAGDSATNYPFPFPDALQEFKVETSAVTAQNGIHSGATVSAVSKSGTNSYHGDAFEFLRNGDMNARNFFATSRDSLKRNQYGGTVGGPIKKNKLFFFAGWQATLIRQDPTATPAFVPTAQMLAGNFTSFAAASCNGGKPLTLSAPFVNNTVSPSLFSPAALKLQQKLPTTSDPCGRTIFGAIVSTNENQITGRVDYQISDKQTLFGRYMALTFTEPPAYGLSNGNILSTVQSGLNNLFQSYIIGDTYLVSSTLVSSARLAVLRTGVERFNDDYDSGCDLGVQMYCFLPHQSVFSVTNGFSISSGTAVQNSPTGTTYVASDDISLVHGPHQFGFGASAWYLMANNRANVYSAGNFGFNGTATGSGLSDFLLGDLDTFSQGTPNVGFTRKWYTGLYVADTWKYSSKLTINMGVRWEPSWQTQVSNGDIYDWSQSNFNQNIRSTVYTQAPAGLIWPGDPGFPNKSGVNRRFDQFAPRFGLGWDPKGDGKTVLRAGFGINYDTTGGSIANSETAPPFGDTIAVTGPVPFTNPWINTPGGNPFPACGENPCGKNAGFTPNGTYIALQPNMKTTAVDTWNVTIQRQFGTQWLVSASYAGSETSHLWMTHQLNPGQFLGTGPCTLPLSGATVWNPCSQTANLADRRLFSIESPQNGALIGFMDLFDAGGTSNYNGLILSLQRRLSRGMAITANYTWSHCIGDLTQGAGVNGGGTGYENLNDREADRGNCASQQIAGNFGTDRRQVFNLTALAQTPDFSNKLLHAVVTGWRFAPIFRASTGGFITVGVSTDRLLEGGSTAIQRPDQVLQNPLCSNPGPGCWINPAAFVLPPLGQLPNMGKYNVPSPGFWQLDVALSRIFRLREKMTLETRGEAFNLTNSFHAGISSGNSTSLSGLSATYSGGGNFGQITSALDPRILQVAMKFVF